MLNNKEDYVLFFLIIILVSYIIMNKEKFTASSSSAPPPVCDPKKYQKLCNGKCINLYEMCCPIGQYYNVYSSPGCCPFGQYYDPGARKCNPKS